MPLMTLSIQHGHTLDEARRRLETAVADLTSRLGTLVKRVEWSPDHSQVRLEGGGAWIELRLDEQTVHASVDLPGLGRLLGSSVIARLKEILRHTFQQQLPGGKGSA
jgi:putative polyhydroxyalkanoic acid system protein